MGTTGTPRSLVVAVILSALVAAGALAGAAVIRLRAAESASASGNPTSPAAEPTGCLREPCQVLAATAVGGTSVELVADAGAASGRLRVGGPDSGQVIEATITDRGVLLTQDSLRCVAGAPIACLIRGRHRDGVAGQVVVGRSGSWNSLEKPFVSAAGYLDLTNIDAGAAPEVLAVQYDCGEADCTGRPVFVQVFALNGTAVGCTRTYPRLDRLPGYPAVQVNKAQLTPCATGR